VEVAQGALVVPAATEDAKMADPDLEEALEEEVVAPFATSATGQDTSLATALRSLPPEVNAANAVAARLATDVESLDIWLAIAPITLEMTAVLLEIATDVTNPGTLRVTALKPPLSLCLCLALLTSLSVFG